jgi:hypothetical protein
MSVAGVVAVFAGAALFLSLFDNIKTLAERWV